MKAIDNGHSVHFTSDGGYINCNSGAQILLEREGNAYVIPISDRVLERANLSKEGDLQLWHRRFGHAHQELIQHLLKIPSRGSEKFFCEECSLGKSHRLPYSGTLRQATTPGELVFADLCGPIDTESICE